MDDFKEALRNVKPSVGKGDLKHYEEWMNLVSKAQISDIINFTIYSNNISIH